MAPVDLPNTYQNLFVFIYSRHGSEIASMALHLLQEIKYFIIPHRPGEALKLRIGLHSGPCVAGVGKEPALKNGS